MVDAQTLPPACSRADAELVSPPPWMRSSISWIVDQIALRASTLISATETARSAADRRGYPAWVGCDQRRQEQPLDEGEHPARPHAKVVGQEEGQRHRGDDGRCHRPAGLGIGRLG